MRNFQVIPKVFGGIEVRGLCRTLALFQSNLVKPSLHRAGFVNTLSGCQKPGTCLRLFIPVKGIRNYTTYKGSLYNCVLVWPLVCNQGNTELLHKIVLVKL